MIRLRDTRTGVIVRVRAGKRLGSEWVPVEAEPKPEAPKAKRTTKAAAKPAAKPAARTE